MVSHFGVAHETNGDTVDGYTRATGTSRSAQNGPGIPGLVTHKNCMEYTPLLLTPQAANKTMGQGGFKK